MDSKEHISIYPLDVYVITDAGQEELKRGSTALTPKALELLVLLDGEANVRQIGERARNLTDEEIAVLLPKLIIAGYAQMVTIAAEDGMDFSYFFNADKPAPEPSAQSQERADREAETGAPALQRQGYYVSIARRAAQPRQPTDGGKLSVLVVEDDPSLSENLTRLMRLQGFLVSAAMNREQILAALRRLPSPDLVLLDVRLPDANGFDILMRMKQHPALKSIPVIMLTGEANRESVTQGLAGGADGYVTKPFETEILVKAVRSVLGLS